MFCAAYLNGSTATSIAVSIPCIYRTDTWMDLDGLGLLGFPWCSLGVLYVAVGSTVLNKSHPIPTNHHRFIVIISLPKLSVRGVGF